MPSKPCLGQSRNTCALHCPRVSGRVARAVCSTKPAILLLLLILSLSILHPNHRPKLISNTTHSFVVDILGDLRGKGGIRQALS